MTEKRLGTGKIRLYAAWYLVCFIVAAFQVLPRPLQANQSQAGMASGSDDARVLRQAKGLFNIDNLLAAKQLCEKIRDATGSIGEEARSLIKTIDDININNTKRQSARIAIQRKRFEEACVLLREIQIALDANSALRERYPDLNDLKSKAGGCPQAPAAEPPDPAKSDYEEAIALMDENRLKEALAAFKLIERSHPGYRDVRRRIGEIQQEIEKNLKKTKDERFADRLALAGQSLSSGDFHAMRREVDAAEALRPGDPNVSRLRQQMEAAIRDEENDLFDAITSFYGGQYEQAQRFLEDFLRHGHSPPVLALAHFYQGAALGSRFFLGGSKDEATRDRAIQLFQQTLKDDPEYSPRWDVVSPKIRDLYLAATKKQQ